MITKNFGLDEVFLISEIIDKMGIEADIEKITKTIQTAKVENKNDLAGLGKEIAVGIGIDLVTKLVRNIYKAKDEVKRLVCSMTGLSINEVNKFGLKEIKEFFTELVRHEGFGDFLSQAGDTKEQR